MPNSHDASTLVELLRFRAGEDPDRIAYTFLLNGESEEGHVTYGELDLRARAVAARLQALGARGERALLLYPPGLEYIAALFGCFYAGVTAVPAYPPRRNKTDPRLQSIVGDCGPTLALTTRELLGEAERLCANTPELAGLRWMATEDVPSGEAAGWSDPEADGETIAFLQYTSGSTAAPKGVMVSHGNLLHNFALIEGFCGYTPQTRSVIWLPPYHDMGLIGGILQPLFTGYWAALFSPVAFIQRPARWLEAISRYQATSSGGPNFAYDLCVHAVRPEERAGLDLSHWEIAFNGAEPVRHETLRAFSESFASSGFRARAFYPCYGLAEATLMVTGSRPEGLPVEVAVEPEALGAGVVREADAEGRYRLVGSGRSAASQRVLVVDPGTLRACAPDRVGEVWVAGPSVARGYWGRAAETAETFGAFEAVTGEGPFLRTGDLGFLADGELFITGRLKDLIVIRGRNHYPQDVEQTAMRSHAGLRAGSCAAFSIDLDGEERLVVVQEVSRHAAAGVDVEEVGEAIRRAVAVEHGVQVHAVAVVRPGGVPKTSSGKVQRRACKGLFLVGDLPLVGLSVRPDAGVAAPRGATAGITREALEAAEVGERQALLEELLVERAAQVLGVDASRVDREQPLVALGMDSLRAMELKGALETALGTPVPVSSLLDDTRIDRLAADLLQELFLAEAAAPAEASRVEGECPLSFAQERLWFLDRLEPGSTAYNLSGALRLRGGVDAGALRRSLEEIVRRHDTLRTVFADAGGRPVQRVTSAGPVALPAVDLSRLAPGAREEAARRAAEAAVRTPFDLETGPLFRARLLRLGGEEHLLVLAMHHIVSDGWSAGVLIREVGALYPAMVAGAPSPLPPLPTQYGDWALRQRDGLRGEAEEEQLAYWRERLAGLRPLYLPTDHPRPAVQSFRGATHRFEVPAEVMEGVRALARAEGATLFMALLAAWDLLLSRYTGESDVAVGTSVSNRDRAEVSGLIGMFVNTLVLRVEVAPGAGFRTLLRRARAASLEAFTRQDLPFERLVEEVHPERDLSRNPLFQVMLAPQDAALEPVEVPGATLFPEPLDGGAAIVDLTLYTGERVGGALEASLEYATDLFEAATVGRMAAHLVQLMGAVAAAPELAVAELPLLLPAERAQVLGDWATTPHDYPAGARVHDLFAAQAARTPEAVAVSWRGRTTTYAELDRASARLARLLRRRGVGPEARVGICMGRTPELLTALLAVLRAGGAYVPLDPAYPAERLGYMVEDAGIALVLTASELLDRLPQGVPAVLVLDAEETREALAAGPDGASECGATPENLSHVIFTSGSTGRPKGVMIRHSSTVVLLHWLRDNVSDEERASTLFSTSINFDVSVAEIFGTLCWGGKLVLVENALELPEVAEPVVYASMVPTAARELLRSGGIPASVRTLNLGGEALPNDLAQALYATGTVERVGNLYGPTEDTTYSTYSVVAKGADRVLVGRPLAGTWAYVLDAGLQPVPAGVIGELYLAGDGLARGYAGRPELTAERFLPGPFGAPGSRMYRVMDRVRWRADGELEYFGRSDYQVKVRGFRIEPGEIEAALLAHPGVREAVVVARGEPGGGRRLVAYLSPQDEPVPTAELRAHLKERLPDYMVPSAFVVLERLPLTPNGKVDRRALPEPEVEAAAHAEPAPPSTPVEEILAGIWTQVLGTERVGVHDDFFALGGHSLLGAQVVSRIRVAFEVELPLRALFEAPSVAGLAARIEALRSDGSGLVAPPIEPARREARGALPLSFAQQRLWLVDRLDPGSPAYNMPSALRLRGALDAAALRAGIGELMRRHETLRTTFEEQGGAPVQVVHPPAGAALRVVDLRGLPDDARERQARSLAGAEAVRPFDLARGPLLRSTLLCLDEDDHVLCFTMHHVVGDGWSTDVMVRELSALYDAFSRGEPSPLPELPVQYADFAVWQREWLGGGVLEAQIAYWKERLAGAPPLLEIPTDRPRALARDARAGSHGFTLSPEVARRLRALSRREGATLFMTTLAAWQALLGRYAGQEDVVVGTPVAGRTRVETEGLVGFFVNMLALRIDLGGEPTWLELLGRVREEVLGAYAHQDLPFERLVEELDVERSLTHAPVFQAVFTLDRSAAGDDLALGELEIERFATGAEGAKFDLDLAMAESGEGLGGALLFREGLFEAGAMARMAGHLEVLLAAMAADPERRLSEVPLLFGAERAQVLQGWSGPRADYPPALVHELVAAQAARTPDAAAVVFGGETLTYAALERRADRLAAHLAGLGVGPESRVGVCLERTPELVVALLGVLKAGGAYVPLDPAYPRERLGWMVEDAAVSLVLTSGALAGVLPAGVRPLALDSLRDALAAGSDAAPRTGVLPQNLSHVIFTSGSTGRPKGVMIRHASVVVLLHWLRENVSDQERSSVLFSTSINFDVSVAEVFGTLAWGGRLVLVENALELAGLREPVVYASMVPTAAAELLRLGGIPAGLRTMNLGGEPVPVDLAQALYERTGVEKVGNLYGPTEDTTYSTYSLIRRGAERVLVGGPVANTQAHGAGRGAPAGAAGRGGRAVPGRRRRLARLRGAAGADGRALPAPPVRRAGRADVPGDGPGALAARGRAGVLRADGLPGQGARLPHRAGRDRGGAALAPGGAGGRGDGAGGRAGRPQAGRVRGGRGGGGAAGGRRAAGRAAGARARAHGALRGGGAGEASPDAQRQAGPARPARARGGGGRGGAAGAAHGGRGAAGEGVRGRAGRGAGGGGRGLLRAGRALAAGHARGLAGARGVRGGDAAARAVRGADGGRAGGAGGGAALGRRLGRAARGAGAARGARRTAAVVRAAAAVAGGPAGAGEPRLQHAGRAAAARGAGRGGAVGEPGRAGGAARGAAHRLRGARRSSRAGDPRARRRGAPPGGAAGRAGGGARGGGGAQGGRRGAAPVRPGARAAAAGHAAAAGRGGPRALRHAAPRGQRRVEHGRAGARGLGAVHRLRPRRDAAPPRAAGAVRRLRGVAAPMARGRRPGGPAGLLARAAARRSAAAGGPHGPPAHRRGGRARGEARARAAGRDHGGAAGALGAGGCDAVHDAAGRLAGAAGPLRRPGRPGRGEPRGGPHAGGDGGADRLLRQHAAAPRRPGGGAHLARAAGARAGDGAGGLRPPGAALRAPGGGAGRGAQPHPRPSLPGHVRPGPLRRAPGRHARGPGRGAVRGRRGSRQVRPGPDAPRRRGHARGGAHLQRGPVRGGDHRAHGGAPGGAAGGHGGRPGPRRGGGPAPAAGRARAGPGGVERDREGVPGALPPRAGGAAGGAHPGRGRPGLRKRHPHLSRAGRAGEPAGAPPAPARRGPRGPGGRVHGARPRAGGRPAGDPQGGRRLRPDGPRPPRRAPGLHDLRRLARDRPRPGAPARPPGRQPGGDGLRRSGLDGAGRGARGPRGPGRPPALAVPRQPGVRHLHLGLHRAAQGGDEYAPGRGQPPPVDAGGLRAGRLGRRPPEDALQLRRFGVGALLAADDGGEAGDGAPRRPPRCRLPA